MFHIEFDIYVTYPPSQILELFQQINSSSREDLINFVEEYFFEAGSDLVNVNPVDWVPSPSFLSDIINICFTFLYK